jgi:hypothetical protein
MQAKPIKMLVPTDFSRNTTVLGMIPLLQDPFFFGNGGDHYVLTRVCVLPHNDLRAGALRHYVQRLRTIALK